MATHDKDSPALSHIPYSHCKTRIVRLGPLDLPESASDEMYRMIYQKYTKSSVPGSEASQLRDAIESIKYGIAPPVAFPTETVYGLGADATNAAAVSGIFAAKGRPNDNPLIVHVSSSQHLQRVTQESVPEVYESVIERFWPGPLTILLPVPRDSKFAPNVHPGQGTIGFRMPSSRYARFFIAACDRPIAGPSANSSGKPSPTSAQHVMNDLDGKINFILDGHNCDVGVESTVVDGMHHPPLILRPGGISLEELRSVGGVWANTAIGYKVQHSPSAPSTPTSEQYVDDMNGAPRAPGMKYKHYSPSARLVLFSYDAVQKGRVEEYVSSLMSSHQPMQKPKRVGMLSWDIPPFFSVPLDFKLELGEQDQTIVKDNWYELCISTAGIGRESESHVQLIDVAIQPNIADLAKELFGVLRLFDDLKCDFILAEAVDRRNGMKLGTRQGELWDAVADRLGKASSEMID